MTVRMYTIRSLIFQKLDEHFAKGAKEYPEFSEMFKIVRENFPTSKFNIQAWTTYRHRYQKSKKR